MKICSKCAASKSFDKFDKAKLNKDGYYAQCRDCRNARRREVRILKKEGKLTPRRKLNIGIKVTDHQSRLAYARITRKLLVKEYSASKMRHLNKVKQEAINHYGGKCSCCGESQIEFLTMEHLNGRDKTKRKRTGKIAWLNAKSAGWPTDITLLCYNCNCAKGAYGSCPHTWNSTLESNVSI